MVPTHSFKSFNHIQGWHRHQPHTHTHNRNVPKQELIYTSVWLTARSGRTVHKRSGDCVCVCAVWDTGPLGMSVSMGRWVDHDICPSYHTHTHTHNLDHIYDKQPHLNDYAESSHITQPSSSFYSSFWQHHDLAWHFTWKLATQPENYKQFASIFPNYDTDLPHNRPAVSWILKVCPVRSGFWREG